MYSPRFYRTLTDTDDLAGFVVIEEESDLFVLADNDLTEQTQVLLSKYRKEIIDYIKLDPQFQFSLKTHRVRSNACEIVKKMAEESEKAGVGPMASVAGAIAEFIGNDLQKFSENILIENGGDIFIKTTKPRKIGVHSGESKFSDKIAIEILPEKTPLGICTSSGTVGHSLSFGKADVACVIARSSTLADAFATAIGNIVKEKTDIQKAIDFAKNIKEILGVVIIIKDEIGIWGDIKIV